MQFFQYILSVDKNALFLTNFHRIKKHYDDYERFMKHELNLTPKRYLTSDELAKETFDYSTIVAGSDQCWNIKCEDGDDAYFINFIDSKHINKVAYAPSLGSTNIMKVANNIEKYRNYLLDFKALSVRERNAKYWLEELTNRNVDLLVDPTLLLSKEEWMNSFQLVRKSTEKYIFYYAFKYDKEVNERVRDIAKKYDRTVYVIDAKSWTRNALWKYGFKLSDNGGPLEFLSMMRDADLVLTSSFHGTVFSAIFEKKFWFMNSSMHSEDDDRAATLLTQIGLTNRFIDIDLLMKSDAYQPIDYHSVKRCIDNEKNRSLKYLKGSLLR